MHTAAGFLEEKLFFRIEKMLHRISVHLSKHGSSPTTFSLFVSFTYMLPYFMQGSVEVNKYNWVLGIKSPSILLCVGLIFRKQWKTHGANTSLSTTTSHSDTVCPLRLRFCFY